MLKTKSLRCTKKYAVTMNCRIDRTLKIIQLGFVKDNFCKDIKKPQRAAEYIGAATLWYYGT